MTEPETKLNGTIEVASGTNNYNPIIVDYLQLLEATRSMPINEGYGRLTKGI